MFEFAPQYKLLRNAALQQELETQGFVKIPLLQAEAISTLQLIYNQTIGAPTEGFAPTTYSHDSHYREQIFEAIRAIGAPILDEHLEAYRIRMASFIVKHPDDQSELDVHQDMTLVDESQFMGVNVWIPLCETTPNNGALHLIPGSHRWLPTYRGPTIPNCYDQHHEEIRDCMQPIYCRAGEAILFDHSILHYSPANKSAEARIAVNLFVTSADATLRTCHKQPTNNMIHIYAQNDDFFTRYTEFENGNETGIPSIGNFLSSVPYTYPQITPEFLHARGYAVEKTLWRRLREWLQLF